MLVQPPRTYGRLPSNTTECEENGAALLFCAGKKNAALCKTSPPLLTCFYSTAIQQSRLFPHQGVCPALCTRCTHLVFGVLQLSTSKNSCYNPPGTTAPVSPLPALLAQATWGCFYQIQSPTCKAVKCSACYSNSMTHVFKTNLFKTPSCYWISSIHLSLNLIV